MKLDISRLSADETVSFAYDELIRYLKAIDKDTLIKECVGGAYNASEDKLWVGIDSAFDALLPEVEDRVLDDGIYINVENGAGIITGTNPRAVLIAVYRFLRELGCAWVRPGADGELLPEKLPTPCSVKVCEAASYRHRTICLEGAVSYDHVKNVIDWIPKAGMSGYYTQFRVPFTFFDRWYRHEENPMQKTEPITLQDVCEIQSRMIEEVRKRGLIYHAIGHGWTCSPFGMQGNGWGTVPESEADGAREYLALVNGKRALWGSTPLNTNLCYSNPTVRSKMADAVVEYCRENRGTDYVHVWLADGTNNHCECDECTKKRPADYYVMMLNEIDSKLTAAGIDTKIVFLIYVDLLWVNVLEKLNNKDRFLMMFAPITRSYTKKYTDYDENEKVELPPYTRNKLVFPKRVEENVAFLRSWQETFDGDSVDFDYHLTWDHVRDPGYYKCAEILFDDARLLHKLGLNGYISCQMQRSAFPTGLPMEMMARALWNENADFETEAKKYFADAFGKDGEDVRRYMLRLSELFMPEYMRGELPRVNPEAAKSFQAARRAVSAFIPTIGVHKNEPRMAQRKSWEYLGYHTALCLGLADMLYLTATGDESGARAKHDEITNAVREIEMRIHNVLDVWNFIKVTREFIELGEKS